MKIRSLLTVIIIASSSMYVHAETQDSPFAVSAIAGMEAYPDSPHSSLSRGMGMSILYDTLGYNGRFALGQSATFVRGTYYYERDSELYDEDRYRNSGDLKVSYQRPFMAFGADDATLLSAYAHYEGHYNSQQLEEYEQLAVVGLALDRSFGEINRYDIGLVAGVAYSEEEKDDDWPKEQGYGTDVLNRAGFGYYLQWNNAYTFAHTGVQLSADVSHFEGHWGYSSGQYYVENQFQLGVVVPLSNKNNLLHFSSEVIKRDYEVDLLGFDDKLLRVGVEYVHYF